jgi:hypothetical protein
VYSFSSRPGATPFGAWLHVSQLGIASSFLSSAKYGRELPKRLIVAAAVVACFELNT